MPELTPQERLQPALLDRLTDEEPTKTQEAPERRVMSKIRLRQAVLRDLAWLFNSTKLTSTIDLSQIPHVRRSVLNYGLPALSGHSASSLDVIDLERSIRQAIIDFEPRILPESLEVKALALENALDHHNVVGVQIRGALWAQPVPLELLVRTEIDLETGKVEIADMANARAV
jgi:type VI secretion system protein ImpF